MGNGMNKVLPGLYIGNFRDAKDEKQISSNKITHILAAHDNAVPSLENIEYKCLDIADSPSQNIGEHFKDCINFIHQARKNNGNVLVHCIAGISRSCTICAAYLIVIAELHWEEAIRAVRSAREVVNPNYGFQKQLQTFDMLDARKIRQSLISKYGEFDNNDVLYLQQTLKEYEQTVKQPKQQDANEILGTTPTFGNYERKRNNDQH